MGAGGAAAAPLEPEAERMPDWRRGWSEASELCSSDQKRSRDGTKPRNLHVPL